MIVFDLICISQMISDVEHLSMHLLAISISSLEKRSLFRSSAHFKIRLLGVFAIGLYEFLIYFGD